MPKVVRSNVFETNSSSCHSLTIPMLENAANKDKLSKPINSNIIEKDGKRFLKVILKEMLGELDVPNYYTSLEDKISFLICSLLNSNKYSVNCYLTEEDKSIASEMLLENGLLNFETPENISYIVYEKLRENEVFQNISFNKEGLNILNKIKVILKKNFNIDDILVSQYFYGENNGWLDYLDSETDYDEFFIENYDFLKSKYVFCDEDEEKIYLQTKIPYKLVPINELKFYSNYYSKEACYPYIYSVVDFGVESNYFDLPFYKNENLLEKFLLDGRSFIRIASSIVKTPINEEEICKFYNGVLLKDDLRLDFDYFIKILERNKLLYISY